MRRVVAGAVAVVKGAAPLPLLRAATHGVVVNRPQRVACSALVATSSVARVALVRAAHTVAGVAADDAAIATETLRRKLRQNTRYRGTRENIVLLSTFADVRAALHRRPPHALRRCAVDGAVVDCKALCLCWRVRRRSRCTGR